MNQCTALIRTQLTLTTLTFAEIAFWEIIFADGKIIINLYGLIFAIGRYVIVVSSMIIVGEFFFAKLPKMYELNQYNSTSFASVKKQNFSIPG